jgi:hypothetical protein
MASLIHPAIRPWMDRSTGWTPHFPLWAIEFASDDEAPVAFVAPADRLDYVLEARADGEGPRSESSAVGWPM